MRVHFQAAYVLMVLLLSHVKLLAQQKSPVDDLRLAIKQHLDIAQPPAHLWH